MGRKKRGGIVWKPAPPERKKPTREEEDAAHNRRLRIRMQTVIEDSLENGGLASMYKVRSEQESEKEMLERRTRLIKLRKQAKISVPEKKPRYPIEHRIQIDLSKRGERKREDLEHCLSLILLSVNGDDVYMYNPTGHGTGYKYYRGERVIVYQVTELMTPRELQRMPKYIAETELCGKDVSKKPNKVYKVVFTTVPFKRLDGYEYYDMGNPGISINHVFLSAYEGFHSYAEFMSDELPPKLKRKVEKFRLRKKQKAEEAAKKKAKEEAAKKAEEGEAKKQDDIPDRV